MSKHYQRRDPWNDSMKEAGYVQEKLYCAFQGSLKRELIQDGSCDDSNRLLSVLSHPCLTHLYQETALAAAF